MNNLLLRFSQYQKNYDVLNRYGVQDILKAYLGYNFHYNLPINISHGIDLDHLVTPQDIKSISPIHWSYNKGLHNRSLKYKPSLLCPHPWFMVKQLNETQHKIRYDYLLISPPGSLTNNKRLLDILESNFKNKDITILIKDKGQKSSDEKFWREHGFQTVSASPVDNKFYFRLFEILSSSERIISPSASSALVFASSLDKPCYLINNFFHRVYEVREHLKSQNLETSWFPKYLNYLNSQNFEKANNLARDKLGFNLDIDPSKLMQNLQEKILEINDFIYSSKHLTLRRLRILLFRITNKSIFLSDGIVSNMFLTLFSKNVLAVEKNDIDIFLNGLNNYNYKYEVVKYSRELTRPGMGF